ncbi:MAG: hypothetical protein IT538_07695 [Variibacter sp.]|nr:hypothetical protein [Variibacter sp.]
MTVFGLRSVAASVLLAVVSVTAAAQPVPPRSQSPGVNKPVLLPSVQVRTLELRDITFGTPETGTVTFGHVTFTGFASGSDTAKAERATFEGIVVQAGPHRAEIPQVTVSGFEVPVEFFRAMTEGNAASLDWSRFLQKATIAEVKVGEIAIRHPDDVDTIVRDLVAKGFANGRLESLATAGFDSRNKDSKTVLSFGETVFTAVDVAELVRFWSGGGAGEAKPLVERVVLNEAGLIAHEQLLEIGKIELGPIDGRAPAQAPGARAAPVPALVLPGSTPAGDGPAAYAREVLRTLRANRIGIEKLALTSAQHGTYKIGSFVVTNLSGRGLDLLEFRGVDFTATQGAVKLDRFAIEKVGYGGVVDALLDAAASGDAPDFSPPSLAKMTPRVGAIRLAKLEVETPKGPIALGEARIEVDNPDSPMPERATFAIGGLRIDLTKWAPDPGIAKLRGFGYDELAADAQIQTRWAAAERALLVENTSVMADRVGRVEFALRFGDVDLTPAAADPAVAEQIMSKARLESLMLRLSDLGLANRLFAEISRNSGLPQDAMRTALALQVKTQAAANFGPALSASSLDALEAFIRSPRRIEARVTTRAGQPPVTLGELEGLAAPQLLERIQIELTLPQN